MTGLSVYLIGFVGTADFRKVRAHNLKEAKTLFAQYHNCNISPYITSHKWTAENWNKTLNDSREAIRV